MGKLNHKVTINAPVDKLWEVLTDLERVAVYNPMVKTAQYVSNNKTGVGASRECQFNPKGKVRERVTAIDEKKSISMEMYESDWPLEYMRWTNYLTPNGNNSTILETHTEYKVKFGVLGTVMDSLMMKPKFNKVLNDLFVNMKTYVENNS